MLTYNDLAPDQIDCLRFIDEGEDALVLADVGSGKTVIGLTAAKRALEKGEVSRWLVFAPKRVALHVWAQEVANWEHLKGLEVAVACGEVEERQRIFAGDAPIVVTNYENMVALFDAYPVKRSGGKRLDTLPFDGLLCDEIDKLKTVGTERFKSVRHRIERFRRRLNMTGTPRPNALEEIWAAVYMTDGGQTFGRSFVEWRRKFFYPTDFKQYNWAPHPWAYEAVLDALQGLAYRLEATGVPPVVFQKPRYVELPPATRKLYAELEKELFAEFEKKGVWYKLDADNQGVATGKLEQLTAGFSYVENDEPVWHSRAKLDTLRTMQRVFSDKQLMVAYHFKEELKALEALFPPSMFRWIGKSDKADAETIAAWNSGALQVLGVHPASAGHGLNLQHSGAHTITGLTLPWSGGLMKQFVGRLARRGQKAKQVDVWPILCADTIDVQKLDVIQGRIESQQAFLDALKKRNV